MLDFPLLSRTGKRCRCSMRWYTLRKKNSHIHDMKTFARAFSVFYQLKSSTQPRYAFCSNYWCLFAPPDKNYIYTEICFYNLILENIKNIVLINRNMKEQIQVSSSSAEYVTNNNKYQKWLNLVYVLHQQKLMRRLMFDWQLF